MSQVISSGLTLMRRMPPALSEKSLAGLSKLIEDEDSLDQVIQRADKPLSVQQCAMTGSEFILCEFNKDGDSYRSPWSNKYQPDTSEGVVLPENLRKLELKANEIFNEYRRLYYDGGVSSVYLWETGASGFACAFLIKRDIDPREGVNKASWECSNLIQVDINLQARSVTYSTTSTVFLQISANEPRAGTVDLSGSLTRQSTEHKPCSEALGEFHIYNMIAIVENLEGQLRRSLDGIYIDKTKEILDRTRHIDVQRSRVKLVN